MKSTDADRFNHVCPNCAKRLARDLQARGFVRHLDRMDDGSICPMGPTGERDGQDS